MDDQRIEIIGNGEAVLAENGPLRLVIKAYSGGKAELELARLAAQFSFTCLKKIAAEQSLLRQPHPCITGTAESEICQTMIDSVRLVGDRDLTPMAAVAGTIADYVADFLFQHGVDRAIVDNGGDVAIRLRPAEVVKVGFRPEISSQKISHIITLSGRNCQWGVNTSGLGGRSLTRGIATGVTAIAATSTVADAAATAIANSCFVDDTSITRLPANTIDPNSDLGSLTVTYSIHGLSQEGVESALANGLQKAELLVEQDIIGGALLAVGDCFRMTSEIVERVGSVSEME